jgi:hypothetical protein
LGDFQDELNTTFMELSSLRKLGLSQITRLQNAMNDVLSRAESGSGDWARQLTRCANVMRPIAHTVFSLASRTIDGPADAVLTFGLRLWISAWLLRHAVTAIFLLFRLLRKSATTVLAIGTGSTRSVGRKDAWRYGIPVREVALAPLHTFQFVTYNAELLGQAATASALLINAFTEKNSNMLVTLVQQVACSVVTLRPVRMVFTYPLECLVIYPLIWAYLRYRSVNALSRAKVNVVQTTNVYMGGEKKKTTYEVDMLLIAHLALKTSGLPWIADVFLCYRNSVIENGLGMTSRAAWATLLSWWRQPSFWSRCATRIFEGVTMPLAVCASLLTGTRRSSFVPAMYPDVARTSYNAVLPVLPGLGAEPPLPPRNALVEVYRFPHGIGLELFARGGATLIGGDALKEIAVVTEPRFLVKMPLKPVQNNTFAFDLLALIGPCHLKTELERLTKVPANAWRNAVEIQKFVTHDIAVDLDSMTRSGMTLRQFLLAGLRLAYDVRRHGSTEAPPFNAEVAMADYLTAETRKHHPGWTTRALAGQTKADAWVYSLRRAVLLFERLLGGEHGCLRSHVWLFLGVVKKQAERKPNDEEYRSRGAVIPEQELQLIWTHLMKVVTTLLEEGRSSWAPHFELFHGKLFNVWGKFAAARDCVFVNEDMRDHGASLEMPIAQVIAEFYGSLVTYRGDRLTEVFSALFGEMITGFVGLPDTDGAVHVFRTTRGMKDGVYGTSVIGGTYKIIGELYKIWKAWHNSEGAQRAWPDPLLVLTSIRAEIHGDNSLAAYPSAVVPFMSGVQPAVAKTVKEIGLIVKSEESLETVELGNAWCMSWHMSNVGTAARPMIVGWKNTADILKGFFLPERLTNFDEIGNATRAYLGQILISLYILGFWNGEARLFIEGAWRALWMGHDEEVLRLTCVSDFLYKTGLDPLELGEIHTSAQYPYPPSKVVKLWVGHEVDRLIAVTAPGAPSLTDGARLCNPIWQLRESAQFPALMTPHSISAFDYDEEGAEGAGAFGRARPPSGDLPGGHEVPVWVSDLPLPLFEPVILACWASSCVLLYRSSPSMRDLVVPSPSLRETGRRLWQAWKDPRLWAWGAFTGCCFSLSLYIRWAILIHEAQRRREDGAGALLADMIQKGLVYACTQQYDRDD